MRPGRREILSIDVGEAETEAFWTEFLRGLVKRGLVGVQLAISDAHAGPEGRDRQGPRAAPGSAAPCTSSATASATPARISTACWRRLIRPIFNAENSHARRAIGSPRPSRTSTAGWARSPTMLEDAETDILAFYAFPAAHWRKLRSHQPARALQQGDRPPHRRRRHLPRRPRADPPRRDALHRAKRRVARRPRLPLSRVDLSRPRGTRRSHRQGDQGGGARSSKRPEPPTALTDEMSAELLHHVPGLDSTRRLTRFIRAH